MSPRKKCGRKLKNTDGMNGLVEQILLAKDN
jgi:hypothetical protein